MRIEAQHKSSLIQESRESTLALMLFGNDFNCSVSFDVKEDGGQLFA